MVSMNGTAATGRALANASISISCAQGSATLTADVNGKFQTSLAASMPCLILATLGVTQLHTVAFAAGTVNVTPETDLLITYIAAQLGTDTNGLVAGFPSNAQFRQALGSQTNVLNAQSAVVQNLQQTYGLVLSAPAFLNAPFAVGQPGVDSDLEALAKQGAIGLTGEPDPGAVSLIKSAGAANPLAIAPQPASGGSTGTSGTSGTSGTGGIGGTAGMM